MRAATRAMRSGCCDDARRSRSEEMWTRITRCSDRRSYHPPWVSLSLLGRSARQLRTLTTEILSFDEMRRDTPLDAVIESFFRANYDLSPKTEEFYRLSLRAFSAWITKIRRREPIVADVDRFRSDLRES